MYIPITWCGGGGALGGVAASARVVSAPARRLCARGAACAPRRRSAAGAPAAPSALSWSCIAR
jgi:hypothetical protein